MSRAAVGAGAAAVFPSGPNLLTNPGFEEDAAGWLLDPRQRHVDDPKTAASGRGCVMGQTAGSNQAARRIQAVEVRSNRLYHFRIRARAIPA